MGNMSYCRFENTARDLADCVDALNNGHTEDLNDYEKQGLNNLLYYAARVVDYADDIMEIVENK